MGLKTTASVLAAPFATSIVILLVILAMLVGGNVEVVDGDRTLVVGDIEVPLTQAQHAAAIIGDLVLIAGMSFAWGSSTLWLVYRHVTFEQGSPTPPPGTNPTDR